MEQKLDEAIHSLVQTMLTLSGDPYFREAAAKYVIREISWALVDKSGLDISQYEVADQLEGMAEIVRKREEEAEADE